MRAPSAGRVPLVFASVLALLVTGGLGGPPAPTAAAASARVESAWRASVGTGGGNGSATVRAFDTARGSVILSLRRLTPSARYAVVIRRGACASLGRQVTAVGTFTATASGALSAIASLTTTQVAAIRSAAVGTSRVSLVAGAGTRARCGTLAKSLAVTPQVWFGPIPSWSDLPYVGSTDFKALFDANAAWPRTAGRTHVFTFFTQWIDRNHAGTATDAELRREIAGLKARDIAIGIDYGPLVGVNGCGMGVEGYMAGAQGAIRVMRRIASLGGTVRYIRLDEPLHGGVVYDGKNACRSTVEKTAQEVARFVRQVRAAYPSIIIGDIEPWPAVSTEILAQWLAAYEAAAGSPFPFLHLDVGWAIAPSDWVAQVHAIERDVRGHDSRFGLIYNGFEGPCGACTDADWLVAAQAHVLAYELAGGGPPDDAIFQSWMDHPDRALPEAGPNTFTHLIADYARTRTAMTNASTPATTAGTIAVTGSVRTLGGDPVAGGRVALAATPRDGRYQVLEFRGTVPAGASEAVIGIRVNTEGAGPGAADLTIHEVGYAEGSGTTNLVPNGRFEWGWGPSDDASVPVASDRGSGMMLRVVATSTQAVGDNSGSFAVTPGAAYRFWIAVRVPEASVGSAYVAPIFLKADQSEVRRDIHPLAPAPIPAGAATTDSKGAYTLTTSPLDSGRYRLLVEYAGNPTYWPARARTEVTVPRTVGGATGLTERTMSVLRHRATASAREVGKCPVRS